MRPGATTFLAGDGTWKTVTSGTGGGVTSYTDEQARDAIGAALMPSMGSGLTIIVQDANDRIFIDSDNLNQAEVDARVKAGVLNWAEASNTDDIPDGKIPNAIARLAGPVFTGLVQGSKPSRHIRTTDTAANVGWVITRISQQRPGNIPPGGTHGAASRQGVQLQLHHGAGRTLLPEVADPGR